MQNGSHSNSDHFQAVHAQKTNSAFFPLKEIIIKVADVASMMTVYKMMQLSFLPNVTVFKQVICHLSSNKPFIQRLTSQLAATVATAYLDDAIST